MSSTSTSALDLTEPLPPVSQRPIAWHERPRRQHDNDLTGNAAAGLSGLLDGLGIVAAQTRDSIEDVIAAELARRNLQARVAQLRYGALTLESDPQNAHLVRYDIEPLLAALADLAPGVVRSITVRVARAR